MSPNNTPFRRQFQALRGAGAGSMAAVNISKPVPLWLLLAAAPAAVQAQAALSTLPPAVPADTLPRALALVAEAAAALAPPGARVQVLPGALDSRLKLAACTQVQPQLPAGVPAWGRSRVGLRCVEGPVRWNVSLPVTVQVWAPALVPTTALAAGSTLDAERLALAEVDWAAAPSTVYADRALLVGRVLARPVLAGQALRAPDLQARQWFAAGEQVQVVAGGSGFRISTEGLALAAGVEGQPVRVRIGDSHIAAGRAVGPKRVEVGL